jgi:hypothetical protein
MLSAARTIGPGPCYYPNGGTFGKGPSGKGAEYSTAGRTFACPLGDKRTREAERPGPQYNIPSSLSQQFESHKWSHTAGKFSASERRTMEMGPERSPGPAAYDTRPSPVTEQRKKKLFGSATRFYPSPPVEHTFPGPGAYKVPGSVGGLSPAAHSAPVVAFSKAHLRDGKVIERSPGPIYTATGSVGTQYSSDKISAGKFGFGTASRFPVSGLDLVDHMQAVHRVRVRS